jgi:hypothetical protein
MTPDDVALALDGLRDAARHVTRPPALGELELTITPPGRLTPESVAGFAELGVHRLVPRVPPRADGVERAIDNALEATARL